MTTDAAKKFTDHARRQLTLIGPTIPTPDQTPTLRGGYQHAPKTYICAFCDREFTDRWQMQLHNATNPEYCQDRATRKEKAWAAKVGLDA